MIKLAYLLDFFFFTFQSKTVLEYYIILSKLVSGPGRINILNVMFNFDFLYSELTKNITRIYSVTIIFSFLSGSLNHI